LPKRSPPNLFWTKTLGHMFKAGWDLVIGKEANIIVNDVSMFNQLINTFKSYNAF
jgi:hypothetical protein